MWPYLISLKVWKIFKITLEHLVIVLILSSNSNFTKNIVLTQFSPQNCREFYVHEWKSFFAPVARIGFELLFGFQNHIHLFWFVRPWFFLDLSCSFQNKDWASNRNAKRFVSHRWRCRPTTQTHVERGLDLCWRQSHSWAWRGFQIEQVARHWFESSNNCSIVSVRTACVVFLSLFSYGENKRPFLNS